MPTTQGTYRTPARAPLAVSEAVRRSMRANRAVDTRPELRLRAALWSAGLRGYRKNLRGLPGTPDLAWTGRKLAVFLHGCFWHGCPVCAKKMPRANADYWSAKVARNQDRDREVAAALESLGYAVLVVWECELARAPDAAVERVREAIDARSRRRPPGAVPK